MADGKVAERKTQYRDEKVAKLDTPIFDHEASTTIHRSKRIKWLQQGGNKFTNAELNRFTHKWEPEPKFLGRPEILRNVVETELDSMVKKLFDLTEAFDDLRTQVKEVIEDG